MIYRSELAHAAGEDPRRRAGRHRVSRGGSALYGREPLRWTAWTTAWEELAHGREPIRIVAGPPLIRSGELARAEP